MKIIAIAIKDLWRAFRSFFALAFMFGVPILMTAMFAFLFGGIGGDEPEFTIPSTDVVIVNQDEGSPLVPNFEHDGNNSFSTMGEMLVDTLQQETFEDLMTLTTAKEADARLAVDNQQAGLALIIPAEFTNALIGQSNQRVEIEFYQDPDLSLGPQIIQSIVMSVVDGFSSSSLTLDTVTTVLEDQSVILNQVEKMTLLSNLTAGADSQQEAREINLNIITPTEIQDESDQANPLQTILRNIMAGMMIFYAFFTGTSAAQTILQEQENGTLARLFMTPTPTTTILNGKFLAGFLMIIVQVIVLLGFANLVFGIHWGPVMPLLIASIGLVALATSFGIFVMSLVKNTKQAGIIYGAVLTFTGMLGMSSVFVMGTSIEKAFDYLPLLVPQGWAMNAFEASWNSNAPQTLLYTGGMLILAVLFFTLGNTRFKKRFN
ncbi:MAG TPA: ABC transporter permease [Brevefilum sp.]